MGKIIDFRKKKRQREKEKEEEHQFLRESVLEERAEWEELLVIEIYESFGELSLDNMERVCRNLHLFLKRKKRDFYKQEEKSGRRKSAKGKKKRKRPKKK